MKVMIFPNGIDGLRRKQERRRRRSWTGSASGGKVALVTGAGQGIGRGYAHALGEAGAAVAVVDISEDKAREVAEELSEKGIDSMALTADVTPGRTCSGWWMRS